MNVLGGGKNGAALAAMASKLANEKACGTVVSGQIFMPPIPVVDEAQVVGEVLEWLRDEGRLSGNTLELQRAFFAHRDK